jgi:uncharacterized protein YneF (UPF0154 family)
MELPELIFTSGFIAGYFLILNQMIAQMFEGPLRICFIVLGLVGYFVVNRKVTGR